jgi:NTP pyrophosphatase (non-canonical NTP hydrolase)
MDESTTVAELRRRVQAFVDARDWRQFHSPKNLAMSTAIEAAELMEHFQWLTVEQSRRAAADPARREPIADEMADVFCYLLAMANQLDIDLASATTAKLAKNEQKYPAEKYRGRYGPEDPGPR